MGSPSRVHFYFNYFVCKLLLLLLDDEKNSGVRRGGRGRTVTAEENDAAMQIALQKFKVSTVLSPKTLKPKEEPPKKTKNKLELIDQKTEQVESTFKKLEEKQQEFTEKLKSGAKDITDDQLKEHALDLQILYTEQETVKQGLEDAIKIVTDYLRSDGREALVKFFQVK